MIYKISDYYISSIIDYLGYHSTSEVSYRGGSPILYGILTGYPFSRVVFSGRSPRFFWGVIYYQALHDEVIGISEAVKWEKANLTLPNIPVNYHNLNPEQWF